jgi:hypothetical protein
VSPSPTLHLKQPLLQEPGSSTPAEATTTLLVFIDTARPEVSLQYRMMNWHFPMRRWISKPPVRVLIVLAVLALVSFIPALLTDSHDVQLTEGQGFDIEGLPFDEDGVGLTSSNATYQDG